MTRTLILGSSSPYRKELLQRLQLPFNTASPDIDETPLDSETPEQLVMRLGQAKARAIAERFPDAIIIAGDQAAVCDGVILNKPMTHCIAVSQLQLASGKAVTFLTSLCVLDARNGHMQSEIVPFHVHFRHLSEQMIENYLAKEPAYNCAGSFKSERLGIALCERFDGDDPTALIGLPLIRLCSMLQAVGVEII